MAMTAPEMGICSGTASVAERASGIARLATQMGKKVLVIEKIRSSSLHRQVDRLRPIIIGQRQMHLRQISDLPSPLVHVNFK
jgi:hypothetical protein